MSGPIDTIRETLETLPLDDPTEYAQKALAALAEVEHQLAHLTECAQFAGVPAWTKLYNRAVAAETALAEANREKGTWREEALQRGRQIVALNIDAAHREAAERRANDLADALREHQWNAYTFVGMRPCIACGNEEKEGHQPGCPVGAALDRQEQP